MPSRDIRPPAVAGTFYPEDASALKETIETLLANVERTKGSCAKAYIVPHAGYVYSGPIAAAVYAQVALARDRIKHVVLLGPAHHVPVWGLALPGCHGFETPLGSVPIAMELAESISELPQVSVRPDVHASEHSLEVQLPFLQLVLDSFDLLPLAVGEADPVEVAQVLRRVWGGDDTLILVSSDLSHYLSYDSATSVDRQTASDILSMRVPLKVHSACGVVPINGLLLAAKENGLHVGLLDLRNSGDTAGDRRRVVGYGAFSLSRGGALRPV